MSNQLDRVLQNAGERPVPLEEILDRVEAYLDRFVAYPSEAAKVAHVLWIVHTHLMDEWESTPRIAFLSPEPASGKSRALEITETLVPRPVESVNATPAYLFRKVSDPDGLPTILYDEIDTIFGPKAKDNEEVRGMLNAGHRRGAMAGRCVTRGNTITTEELPAYCAVAMAGLNDLPDTIMTRSVVIQMRKRSPNEHVEQYRRRIHAQEGNRLREAIAVWSDGFRLGDNYPEMPRGVEDRTADVWEPLLAIADDAGEKWSERARVAAVSIVSASSESSPSIGVLLLSDLRDIFGSDQQLPTETILQRLCELEESPWGSIRGKALDARGLANRLRRYDVKSKTIRVGQSTPKGYTAEDLTDSWERYLQSPDKSATNATGQQCGVVADVADLQPPEGGCLRCGGEGCAWCQQSTDSHCIA